MLLFTYSLILVAWFFLVLHYLGRAKVKYLRTKFSNKIVRWVVSGRQGSSLLQEIINVDEKSAKIADAVFRKAFHFLSMLAVLLVSTLFTTNYAEAWWIGVLYLIMIVIAILYAYKTQSKLYPTIFTAVSRIRDGTLGAKNFIFSHLADFLGLLAVGFFSYYLNYRGCSNNEIDYYIYLAYFPVVFGDASAEVIGTIWGKQKIKVYGIGEINRKSYLGTTAHILFTLLPLIMVSFIYGHLQTHLLLLILISLLTAIAELFSYRGTDNFTILLTSIITVLCYF